MQIRWRFPKDGRLITMNHVIRSLATATIRDIQTIACNTVPDGGTTHHEFLLHERHKSRLKRKRDLPPLLIYYHCIHPKHDKLAAPILQWLEQNNDDGLHCCPLGLNVAFLKIYDLHKVLIPLLSGPQSKVSRLLQSNSLCILNTSDTILMANIVAGIFSWCAFKIYSAKKEGFLRTYHIACNRRVLDENHIRTMILMKIRHICNRSCRVDPGGGSVLSIAEVTNTTQQCYYDRGDFRINQVGQNRCIELIMVAFRAWCQ